MKRTTKLLSMLLIAVMMLSIVACGGDSPTPDNGSDTTTAGAEATADNTTGAGLDEANANSDGQTFSVCLASEPASIDPAINEAVDGAMMIHHMFEGLYGWSTDGAGNAVLGPAQATSYDKVVNDDGTVVYTFTLRDDALWSDGEKVTASDFEYAWKRAVDPATASTYSYMLDMVVNANEITAGTVDKDQLGAVAIDEQTFQVTLTYDCPYFLEICAFPTAMPVRQDIIEQYGDQWTFDVNTYIGNGKYKLSEWSHNEVIRTVKSETYYGAADIKMEQVNYLLMDDENAMLTAFRNGELDFIQKNFPVDELPTLLGNGEVTVDDYIGTYYVCFNNEAAPFDDARVREAFALVIDRDYIVAQITQAGELPATGWVPSGIYDANGAEGDDFRTVGSSYAFASTSDEEYEANCQRAKELLAEAGYADGQGFPVTTYIYNTNDQHKAIAEALQAMWQDKLGVTVQLENMDWNAFIEARNSGAYQLCRHGWIADYNDPISFLDLWYSTGGNNDANYSNPDYDAAMDAAKSTADAQERMQHMHEAEDILFTDYGISPIYFYVNTKMLNQNFDGLYYTPLGYYFFDQMTAK